MIGQLTTTLKDLEKKVSTIDINSEPVDLTIETIDCYTTVTINNRDLTARCTSSDSNVSFYMCLYTYMKKKCYRYHIDKIHIGRTEFYG